MQQTPAKRQRGFVIVWTALWVIILGLIMRGCTKAREGPTEREVWTRFKIEEKWGRTVDPVLGYRPGVANCNLTPLEQVARNKHTVQMKAELRESARKWHAQKAREETAWAILRRESEESVIGVRPVAPPARGARPRLHLP